MSAPQRLKFFHGLGDVVMFRQVLDQLDGPIELFLNPELGQSQLFRNNPKVSVIREPEDLDAFREVCYYVQHTIATEAGPAVKNRVCLEYEFDIIDPKVRFRPLPTTNLDDLDNEHVAATHTFLKGLGPYVICHFQGTSDTTNQNPSFEFAKDSVTALRNAGWDVVVVNYDYVYHNPDNPDFSFIDHDHVRSTFKKLPMEVESLWTLLRNAHYFIGVDSGPLHLALTSQTPCAYIKHRSEFLTDFYDEGLEKLTIIDTAQHKAIPESLIQSIPKTTVLTH